MTDDASQKKVVSFSIDVRNADYLDSTTSNRSAFINDLITAHRVGGHQTEQAILEMREQQLRTEIDTQKSKTERLENELERVQSKKKSRDEQLDDVFDRALEVFEGAELTPGDPASENWAEKAGLTPEEFVDELERRR